MSNKLNVWIICGGRSAEHEVSLRSARSVASSLDRRKYNLHFVTISKQGEWVSGEPLALSDSPTPLPLEQSQPDPVASSCTALSVSDGVRALMEEMSYSPSKKVPHRGNGRMVAFPVLHGSYGEDGTIQGLFEMLDIPYVGSNVLGSALAMDKSKAKELLFHNGIPVARWASFKPGVGDGRNGRIPEIVARVIGYPCFVKPSSLGSSIGITKVKTPGELEEAIRFARTYDTKVLVEEAVDAREIEVSVLGNDEPIASLPGEIVPVNEFYDYGAKYVEDGTELIAPAELDEEQVERVRHLAIRAFKVLECCGMARADFFLEKRTGRIIVNELNTIPGFTEISMYPRLWEVSGISYPQLLDKLIELALERYVERKALSVNRG